MFILLRRLLYPAGAFICVCGGGWNENKKLQAFIAAVSNFYVHHSSSCFYCCCYCDILNAIWSTSRLWSWCYFKYIHIYTYIQSKCVVVDCTSRFLFLPLLSYQFLSVSCIYAVEDFVNHIRMLKALIAPVHFPLAFVGIFLLRSHPAVDSSNSLCVMLNLH